ATHSPSSAPLPPSMDILPLGPETAGSPAIAPALPRRRAMQALQMILAIACMASPECWTDPTHWGLMPLSKYRFRLRQIRQGGTTRAGERIETRGGNTAPPRGTVH